MTAVTDEPIEILETQAFTAHAHPIRWLWQDYLATGMVTLLTSRWKSGKTTLLSLLLAHTEETGTMAGAAVTPFRTAVVTEEPPELWAERHQRLGLRRDVYWCRPSYATRPTMEQWQTLVARLAEVPADLVVFDPLAMVLPGACENNASALLAALAPLKQLTRAGRAVLLIHHPRKGNSVGELSPRGSGALTGFADILMELEQLPHTPVTDRRRRLRVNSRIAPSGSRVIELSADGRTYSVLDVPSPELFESNWPVLLSIFVDDDFRLTRRRILELWPADFEKPSLSTLTRWLDQAIQEKKLVRTGTGRRNFPFEYALPNHVDLFDPLMPREPQKVDVGLMPSTFKLSVQELAATAAAGGLDRRSRQR